MEAKSIDIVMDLIWLGTSILIIQSGVSIPNAPWGFDLDQVSAQLEFP